MDRAHHRPLQPGDRFLEAVAGGVDPFDVREAAERTASIVVRGAHDSNDPQVAERLLHLAETEGIEVIAELWAGAPADSLSGCLWRLYLLRSWVYADPVGVAHAYEAGRAHARVAEVVAGVADPPGPEALQAMVDQVLRGIAVGDFADVLFRAAAFTRVVAFGREEQGAAARLLRLAEELEAAGHAELAHRLG